MGMIDAPQKCHLFDLQTTNIPSGFDGIEYFINNNNIKHKLKFNWNYENSDFIIENKYILKGLLYNNKFPFLERNQCYNIENIEQIIKEAQVPKTPKGKLDNLLLYIQKKQNFEGEEIGISITYDHQIVNKLYLKNEEELSFYIETLFDLKYIYRKISADYYGLQLTFLGLEYLIKLEDEGQNSKKCFIAMSFSVEALQIRNRIKNSIDKCGYEPILIDEVNYDSEITINDAMIGFIRKSKFVVADFTHHKNGVYFEAGFALGLRKPVIYTCHKPDFSNTHFDTNHYPHIVYETYEELEEKLIDKINAWII